MSEEATVERERDLAKRTAKYYDKNSTWCSICYGKLANIFTANGLEKGTYKFIKSVYDRITWEELSKILYFNEPPLNSPVEITLLFWKLREHRPFEKHTLHYNSPRQLENHEKNPNLAWVKKLVK